MYKFFCCLFFISLVYNASVAGTIDPSVSDSKYVKYGQDFVYVGKLCGSYTDGGKFCASAVAIDDFNILTAAHVVKGSDSCKITINSKVICVSNIICHKDFEANLFGIADIAVGHCDSPIGLKFYPALYDDESEVDSVCSISGYGLTGNFKTGARIYDGKKRAGSNRIDRIEKDLLICDPSARGSKGYTSLEFLIASGDSGGGLFIGNRLAGINSCVMVGGRSPNSSYGEESGHTRISKFIEWIKENRTKPE
jgi:hypothetical protein